MAFPVSFAQRRMWFLSRLDPRSPVYNIPTTLRLAFGLDRGALQRAVDEIIGRHEALRTTFAEVDGEPVQVIAPPAPRPIRWVDLRRPDAPPAAREAEAARLAHDDAIAPFDLQRGPLFRVAALCLDDADTVLLVSMHHIVSDGWSVNVLLGELQALYGAFATGAASPLPELSLQYADYAAWQRDRLRGELLDQHLSYWRTQLAGAPPVIELPLDRPRPAVKRHRGAIIPLVIPGSLASRLRAVSQAAGATPFMLLLASFAALLHRYTGQADLVIGTPVANRSRPELEPLIGLFANTLALRIAVDRQAPFHDLLGYVRAVTLGAYAHEDLPFELLVEDLQPVRSLAHNPLFQVMLVMQHAAGPASPEAAGPEEPPPAAAPIPSTAKFDLTVSITDGGGGFVGGIEYDTDLFDAPIILQLAARWRTLLEGVADSVATPVGALPLIDGELRKSLLAVGSGPERTWDDRTIPERIAAQAADTPAAVAVVSEAGTLSYAQLDARVLELAHRLRAVGAGPDRLVAVCVERSAELVVAILAILRSGAAYVPIDAIDPRRDFMIADAGPVALVTDAQSARSLHVKCPVVQVGDGSGAPADALAFPRPDDLAYAIFTSGSTGRPKCAGNAHRALTNRILWMQDSYRLGPDDRVLQKTPATFDVSVWEFLWPLMAGATLVVARPDGHRDPEYLARVIREQQITTVHFVPSMLRVFLDHPEARRCTSLRRVIASGEALAADIAQRHFAVLGAELHNLYGPTECAIDVTAWACQPGAGAQVIPIGFPIANARCHVLDERRELVPPGARGELYIGGVPVGRGYLGRPELTEERFVPDPFHPGARLYATGDHARVRADGSIEFLGRIDGQDKLRGLRIEMGEVEVALAGHPGVREAVAVVRDIQPGDRRLIAYCVADPESAGTVTAVARRVRDGLPAGAVLENFEDDLVAVCRNPGETRFLRDEIFVERRYLRHGVAIHPGDVVFDVGANIGLFALFAGARGGTIYAFEPIPQIAELLRINAGLYEHEWDVRPLACAVGDRAGTARFTYYPHVSIMSGRYADIAEERSVIVAYEAARADGLPGDAEAWGAVIESRLDHEEVDCPVTTISQAIRDHGVERIDLLKIDVEKAERDVLRGIADGDWPKIRSVVVEVHDRDGRAAWVRGLLEHHGFHVEAEVDPVLASAGVWMLYATRAAQPDAVHVAPRRWRSPGRLADDVRRHVGRALPDHMVPSAIVWLDALPRLTSGKIDRRALPDAPSALTARARGVRPRTELERQVAAVWSEILARGEIWVDDNFFQLGGHSLLATRVVARLLDLFGVEIPLRQFFETPTVAALAGHLAEARTTGSPPTAHTAIARAPRPADGAFPLSYAQQRLWFLDRFSPGDVAYNIPALLPLRGGVDPALLEASFHAVAMRHEALRTTFHAIDGRPVQVVAPASEIRVRVVSLASIAPDHRGAEARRLAHDEVRRPFDLEQGPLVRALLIALDEAEAHLVITLHHIVADGWSMGVLYRELAAAYQAIAVGAALDLPELPIQYPDFAVWQRQTLDEVALGASLGYWRERLAHAPALMTAPADFPRPAVQSRDGAVEGFLLDGRLIEALRELSQRDGATLYMTLLAALYVVLHRLSGDTDLVIGSPIANRTRREIEGLIGFFANTLALRADLRGDPSFRTLLAQVRETTLGAYANQHVPFESLVEALQPHRSLDHSPVFQVMLIVQNIERGDAAPGSDAGDVGASGAPMFATSTAKFDLSLYITDDGTRTAGALEYCTALFSPATARRLIQHYVQLLASIASDPDVAISRLGLSGPDEPAGAGEVVASVARRVVARPLEISASDRVLVAVPADDTWSAAAADEAGATVIVPSHDPVRATRSFARELVDSGVTLLVADAALVVRLAQEFPRALRGVRLVATAATPGDLGRLARAAELVGELCAVLPTARGIWLRWGEPGDGARPLLAAPPGAVLRLVDRAGQPACYGAAGEVVVEVPDGPAITTGVLGRLRSDGQLEWYERHRSDRAEPEAAARPPYVAPRDELEEGLARLFAQVFRDERIGIHDDFFALGGHSLLATQLVARAGIAFGIDLPLRTLFEAPTIAALAPVVAELRKAPGAARPPIRRQPRDRPIPLSFAQQRLWFLDQYQPGSAFYNIAGPVALASRVDERALERAVNALIARHETLRTTFRILGLDPVQVIAPELVVAVPVVDLRAMPVAARSAEALRLAREEAATPFDLSVGPLFRARLLRLADDDHMLLVTIHHIIADGWSMTVLLDELGRLYHAAVSGGTPDLPELRVQYADYTCWQRGWLAGVELERQLAYWRRALAGAPALLELPTDRPRPPRQEFRGDVVATAIPAAAAAELLALARTESATLYMVCLAGFVALLHRLCDAERIVVGTPIANRTSPELEHLIGFFANTLVLHTDVSGDPSFRALIGRVREVTLGAYAHQDLPFEKLVEEIAPERNPAYNPLFQVMFAMQQAPTAMPADRPAPPTRAPERDNIVATTAAKFDLTFFVTESAGGLEVGVEYNSALFDRATAARYAARYITLLASVVARPESPVSELRILTDDEQASVMAPAAPARSLGGCVPDAVERRAAEHPDAVALRSGDHTLCYAELARVSAAWASRLVQRGVVPGAAVGILLERSLEAAVATLAVMRSGACVLPLDPRYPAERLAAMVAIADPPLVITSDALAGLLPPGTATISLALSDRAGDPVRLAPVRASDLAYVIFTSGSTGTPKGVEMPHGPLADLVAWQIERSQLPRGARTLHYAPMSFDVSFQEMFATWCDGGELVIVSEDQRGDPAALVALIRRARVQRAFLPVVTLQLLAEQIARDAVLPDSLCEIVTAGEQLVITRDIVAMMAGLPACRLFNQYGPSETHVATEYALPGAPQDWPERPPIGWAIPGVELRVVDRAGRPVPIGLPGELYLGGSVLARGYRSRPDLTAERFITDGEGRRRYRTGDRVRRRSDGALEFLGRGDDQIKVRGHRVEPGEVEVALGSHPAVREAVVALDPVARDRLVAWIVPAPGSPITGSELREYLRARLPDYMIPSVITAIDRLPVLPSGKRDRGSLPLPAAPRRADYVAPRTLFEQRIAEIWSEILEVERVGAHDDFFELGGHSLLVARMASRLREALAIDLPVRKLFECRKLESLALELTMQALSDAGGEAEHLLAELEIEV